MMRASEPPRRLRARDTPLRRRPAAAAAAAGAERSQSVHFHASLTPPPSGRWQIAIGFLQIMNFNWMARLVTGNPALCENEARALMMGMIDYSAAGEKCREMDAIISFIGTSDPAGWKPARKRREKLEEKALVSSARCHYGFWMYPHYGSVWLEPF